MHAVRLPSTHPILTALREVAPRPRRKVQRLAPWLRSASTIFRMKKR